MSQNEDEHEVRLINAIEEISTDNLKAASHKICTDRIVKITKQVLSHDGTRLMLLIEFIKGCKQACYKRELLLDVLNDIITSKDILIEYLLCNPFPRSCCHIPWKELANSIVTIPELAANCNVQTRIPLFNRETFQRHLLDAMYDSFGIISKHHIIKEHRMYLIQLLGRVSISGGSDLSWCFITSRAIQETSEEVKSFVASLLRLTITPGSRCESLELFMSHLCMPIFFNLKPKKHNCDQIYSILGNVIMYNEQFKYMICDKSIFKSNYNLDRKSQSILLFNLSAYLSSLVIHHDDAVDGMINDSAKKMSLLMQTLLEIVKQWASPTKALLRSYQQSRHIAAAMLVMFRYAMDYDKNTLEKHADEIQSMIVSALPMYLNRASRDQRDLAMCLGELLLPKLRELLSVQAGGECNERANDLGIKWNCEYTDDLLYLQRLFKQDIEVIFQDATNEADVSSYNERDIGAKNTTSSNKEHSTSSSSSSTTTKSKDEKQLQENKSDEPDMSDAVASPRIKSVVELPDYKTSANIESIDCDLKPYTMTTDGNGETDDDDDDDNLGVDQHDVPIYLRDCINGLVENNNRRYVRLCLIKAGVLIDQLMVQEAETCDQQMLGSSNRLDQTTRNDSRTHGNGRMIHHVLRECHINETINDIGIELARALLLLDNQFNINGFKDYRMKALASLCASAPQLVGKYLIEEFNGINRSIQQQLDILQILMKSAERLSASSPSGRQQTYEAVEVGAMSRKVVRQGERRINRFSAYAALYFYGIVYRLKADFVDNKSLVISQPKSILSAFRELKYRSKGESGMQLIAKPEGIALRQPQSTTTSLESDIDDDVDRFLERNSLSDDSYLLSRIILAASIILSCASQQLAVCKLSSDFLEILAAYRCHPDSGVQNSMIVGLRAIRDSTPRVYYENFLEKRLVHMFGPWVAKVE